MYDVVVVGDFVVEDVVDAVVVVVVAVDYIVPDSGFGLLKMLYDEERWQCEHGGAL